MNPILQALGVLDPAGKPTARLGAVKAARVAKLNQDDWQKERDAMAAICNQCHSANYAKEQLAQGDNIIREADRLMAEAIRAVAGLYQDGSLQKPANYASAFPDLSTFHDAATVIEQKLFVMFLEHRMRTFQGTFHANPDYALWYGWSEMRRDLTEIKTALWQNLWVRTVPPACSSGAQPACPRAGSAKLRQERHIYSQSGRSTTSSVRSGMLRRRSSLRASAAPDGACERLGRLPFL